MVMDTIKEEKVVAIFRNLTFEQLLPQVDLLIENGLTVMEVTLNSPSPLTSIYELKKRYDQAISIGAGTVMHAEEVIKAKDAGAEFIISPHVDEKVIKTTKKQGLISIPGVLTPTEITAAHQYGADILKVFPATTLGLEYVKNLKGPFPDLSFMATGGINEHNAKDYLESGYSSLGVGSSLTTRENESLDSFRNRLEVFTRLKGLQGAK